MNEETIFNEAVRIDSPAERKAFLDRSCGDDLELRENVEALLRAVGAPRTGSYCTACFTNEYPVPFEQNRERRQLRLIEV